MRIILIIIFIITSNFSFANEKIEIIKFVDLNNILNTSNVGKKIITELNKKNKLLLDNFKKKQSSLMESEKKLIAQKNILEKSELDKKILILKDEVDSYNKEKNTKIKLLSQKKSEAQSNLIQIINEILIDYSKEKNISMIIKKESIILGHSSADITKEILEIVNNKKLEISIN